MDPKIVTAIVIVIAVLVVVGALLYTRRNRSAQLKQKFGSEYDRVVRQHGDPKLAETVLAERERRVSNLKLHTLSEAERDRYLHQWTFVQKQFVDDPRGAVNEADRLVTDVMSSRGYPMSEFAQRAEDISVDYPETVSNYRAAHDIVLRHAKGQSTTEDLRRAMVHFRSLFDELLGVKATQKEVA
jgi:FtsZ-interacting cell division protein ZipA